MTTAVAAKLRRNKRAGAEWEALLVTNLRQALGEPEVEQLHLRGAEDEGDLVIKLPRKKVFDFFKRRRFLIVEAKAGELKPSEFVDEAISESNHFVSHRSGQVDRSEVMGISIIKRKGKPWQDAYVLTTVGEFFGLDSGG